MGVVEDIKKIFKYSIKSYFGHLSWGIFFGLVLLLAFLIPVFAGVPTYTTLGSIYLRFNSMPDLTPGTLTIIGLVFVVSTFLISFSVVNINNIVKSERTLLNIPTEMMKSLKTYSLRLFWVCIIQILILWIGQVLFQSTKYVTVLLPLYNFILAFMLIFVPSAIVMEELGVLHAVKRSIQFIKKYPVLTCSIMGIVVVIIAAVNGILLLSPVFPQYLTIIFNVLFVLPFTIILIAHTYINKYSIVG
ncbi:hypothetical protein KO465_06635 [Candidatus Micrarchaeota archaeon]|nr:hypothetical protein [Candidatus Micrarchaeota archaeon]